ncbi:hypothetical protein ABMA27_005073 [Loxostege sticticalis]|uniref:BEN domain-containing protein n=1 Tax=Loxostege sticticalis TaxID=481309 RepID=A0ABR3HLY2_LOXSC
MFIQLKKNKGDLKIKPRSIDNKILATHNLTGKVSPAFPDRMPKAKLDEALVNDIVQTVAESPSETGTRKCQHTL